jgi:thiamine-phosphate pyrophosphorylase
VQLGGRDLRPADARASLPHGWIGRSVHSAADAEEAAREGADYLLVGNVYETTSHPDRPAKGLDLVRAAASLGLPVIAIGGINAARATAAREAGAYGVAAIAALWRAPDPAAAALALLAPWSESMSELTIVVNGEERRVPGPATLLDLLRHLGLDPRTVVVERNREIVRRPGLGVTELREGDAIELVHFVGGG